MRWYNLSKKPYKQFFHGKGILKTVFGSKPMHSKPNSYIDTYNSDTGNFRSRRKYGEDGWAYKDMDTADNHRPYDHVHDIYRYDRSDARHPNKHEKKEFTKAKKKRRFL